MGTRAHKGQQNNPFQNAHQFCKATQYHPKQNQKHEASSATFSPQFLSLWWFLWIGHPCLLLSTIPFGIFVLLCVRTSAQSLSIDILILAGSAVLCRYMLACGAHIMTCDLCLLFAPASIQALGLVPCHLFWRLLQERWPGGINSKQKLVINCGLG